MWRLRKLRLGAWLGVLAVALNAALPIHFAVDIVHAASHARAEALRTTAGAAPHRHDHPAGGGHRHDGACPICASGVAAVATATLPTPAPLVLPPAAAIEIAMADVGGGVRHAALAPYAPRAPPSAA